MANFKKRRFDRYIGIDYSGAGTPTRRSATLQVYQDSNEVALEKAVSPASTSTRTRNWNRIEIADWLSAQFTSNERIIVGMDHGFSFPHSYFKRYRIRDWDHFLRDFVQHWPTAEPNAFVDDFRQGNERLGDCRELRLTEKWTSSAKSVFQFDVQGAVAKSTHAGLPFLHRLRLAHPQIHFWPFDGWKVPTGVSVVAESYPSLFRNRYQREDRTVDQQDAYSIARWLSEIDDLGELDRFFLPPLNPSRRCQASLEGWILGVV
jgi:hypothetical protein